MALHCKTEHMIQTTATERKHNANTTPTCLNVLLLWRSLRLARILRAQALQNLSCKLLLAVLNLDICSGQLEAFLPQHDPYFIPRGGRIHSTLVGRGVEEPGARVSARLTVFYSEWGSPRWVRIEKEKMESSAPCHMRRRNDPPISSSLHEEGVYDEAVRSEAGVGASLCKLCADELPSADDADADEAAGSCSSILAA